MTTFEQAESEHNKHYIPYDDECPNCGAEDVDDCQCNSDTE